MKRRKILEIPTGINIDLIINCGSSIEVETGAKHLLRIDDVESAVVLEEISSVLRLLQKVVEDTFEKHFDDRKFSSDHCGKCKIKFLCFLYSP